jgi:ATP/maltotriose-dependent transcriptional regulator MalT
VASLIRHWILAEHFEEGRAATAAALSAAGFESDASARAVVLCGAGLIGALSEEYQAAVENTHAGLALLAGLDDSRRQARCLQLSGMVLILTGLDLDQGLRFAEQAADLLRASGDPLGLAWAVANVAMAAGVCDQFDEARAAYAEFLSIPGAPQQPRLRTWAELAAAWVELIVGSAQRALEHADRARELEGDRPTMTHFIATCHRVHALALLGRTEDALDEGVKTLARAQESGALMAVPAIDMALVIAELAHGDLEAAAARAGPLVQLPQLHTVALMREALGRAALASGHSSEARVQARELEVIAERAGSARHRALADLLSGSAAALDGEPDDARDCLQAALKIYADLGLERGAADALEELGLLAAAAGDGPRAARLAGAASAARARLSCRPLVANTERLEAARARFASSNGAASWDEARAQGQKLALVDAIAYARRGRGRRDRPPVGWPSLTPAERHVADLAANGMSNPQIANQLFISRSTVKMHLSNIYLKLHVANRTELARVIATHSPDGGTGEPSGRPLARDGSSG